MTGSLPAMRVCEVWGKGGEGSAPFRGDAWGFWSSGVRGVPSGRGRTRCTVRPPCVTGRQRRGPRGGRGCVGDAVVGGRRRGGGPWGVLLPLARLPLSRYLARPGAEV